MTEGFKKVSSLLEQLPGMEKSSLVAPNPNWRDGPLNHYPQPPILDGPFGWPKPERRPGPLPQPGPGGSGGKWECKYVNEPSKPEWPPIFDRPTPGNI